MRRPFAPAWGGATQRECWYRAASSSQRDATHRHDVALWGYFDFSMRGRLNRVNQCLAGLIPLETSKFLGCDDDDLVTPMHGHVLRPFTANLADQFAESSLGILQRPMTRRGLGSVGLPGFRRRIYSS